MSRLLHRAARALAAVFLLALPASALAQPAPPPPLPPSPPPDAPVPMPPAPIVPGHDFTLPPATDQPTTWPPPAPPPAAPIVDGPLSSPFAGNPFANPVVGHVPFAVGYRVTWLPDEAVSGQGTHFGLVEQDASLRFPIWQSDHDELSGTAHVRAQIIHTGAILPDTMQLFPDQLWDVRFGTAYRHLFDNGWIAGGSVSVGSASNLPFHSVNELTAGVNAFLRVPQGEHNAWLFSLSYSPTGELAFPVPGVAFVWVPSDQLRMNIGLPFQVTYRPLEDLTLDFSYMLLTTIHARATYRVCQPVRVYAGFDWSNESWFIVPRLDDKERLFYYEKRLSVGAQTHLGRAFLLDVSTGYVFDRFYFEGQHSTSQNFNRVDIDGAPLLSFQAQLRW